jgi:hypothetical protein
MNARIVKVKNHVKDNSKVYIGTAVGVVVGAAVSVIVIGRSDTGTEIVQKIVQIGLKNERANNVVVNLVERSTASKPVHLVGTNLYFNSLSEAARETGHHLRDISKVVNGHMDDIKGDVFEFLERAA